VSSTVSSNAVTGGPSGLELSRVRPKLARRSRDAILGSSRRAGPAGPGDRLRPRGKGGRAVAVRSPAGGDADLRDDGRCEQGTRTGRPRRRAMGEARSALDRAEAAIGALESCTYGPDELRGSRPLGRRPSATR